jgi:hypothetical protein
MWEMMQILRVFCQVLDLRSDHLLHVHQSSCCWADFLGQLWRAIHDHVFVHLRVFEAYEDWEGSIHSFDDGSLKPRSVNSVDRCSEAEDGNYVHCHAAEGPEEVGGLACATLALECSTQCVDLFVDVSLLAPTTLEAQNAHLFYDQTLGLLNCLW